MATTMPKFKRKLVVGAHGHGRTNPLVWLVAIICTIIAVTVVVVGIAVLIGYIVIHPRFPVISVTNAHLDFLRNDYAGLLQTQLTIVVTAKNGNLKAHATFSAITFNISYKGQDIAVLVADPFEVPKNSSKDLAYVVQSSSIPLNPDQMEQVNDAWNKNEIEFDFKGTARTQWRVGPLKSVKFLCHLDCDLKFRPFNGTYIPSRCTSKSH